MTMLPKAPISLKKKLRMGMKPKMSASTPGASPMMKKGGKVCMSKGGKAKSKGKK